MKYFPLVFVLGLAVACDSNSSGSDNDDDDRDDRPSNGATSTPSEIRSVSTMIYDALNAGEDVTPHVEGVLEAFGIPVLAPDDIDGAQARVDAGLPFVTTQVTAHMGEAFAQGAFVNADGFVAGLVEQGVELAYPYSLSGEPLTSEFLGALIYGFANASGDDTEVPMDAVNVLPAFVWQLGQERGRRATPASADIIWGDGKLDPLQFTLLSSTIFAGPAQGASTRTQLGPRVRTSFANEAADFIKDAIKDKIKDAAEGQVTSAIQTVAEVPLDKGDAAKVSVCGSLILYGHKVTMTTNHLDLWHRKKQPNIVGVTLRLTFEDDYYNAWANAVLGSAVTDLTGCTFPRQGPIDDKPVEWEVSSSLEDHGAFTLMQTPTDVNGYALANWQTVQDDIPPTCETFDKQRDVNGSIRATVSGLMPGWSTVEMVVNFLNPNTGAHGYTPLNVFYYDVATNDPCHNE
jgi:hypothetical protein